jgi:hypothetical protein
MRSDMLQMKEDIKKLTDAIISQNSRTDQAILDTPKRSKRKIFSPIREQYGRAENICMTMNSDTKTRNKYEACSSFNPANFLKPIDFGSIDNSKQTTLNINKEKITYTYKVIGSKKVEPKVSNKGIKGTATKEGKLNAARHEYSYFTTRWDRKATESELKEHINRFAEVLRIEEVTSKYAKPYFKSFMFTAYSTYNEKIYDETNWPNGIIVRRWWNKKEENKDSVQEPVQSKDSAENLCTEMSNEQAKLKVIYITNADDQMETNNDVTTSKPNAGQIRVNKPMVEKSN